MTRQTITTTLIAAMLFFAFACTACSKSADASGSAPKAESASPKSAVGSAKSSATMSDSVVVYYFHGMRRCPTCLGIQKTIEQTLEDRFSEELAAGMLVFEEINYEEPDGKPYVEKFQLSFSSMIVAQEAKGKMVKWDNAEKVWDLAHDQPALADYVEKSVRAYLGPGKGK